MKIHIDDIREGGMQINADSRNTEWLKNVFIEVFGPDKVKNDDGGRLNLQIYRNDRNLTLIGGVILKFHPSCDRCLVEFEKQEQVPIHQIMSPAKKGAKKAAEPEADDEDFSFYTGDEIDLAEIVKEYIILAQEMVNLCKEDCRGLCQTCGKNLNTGACKCRQREKKNSPFSILKKIDA